MRAGPTHDRTQAPGAEREAVTKPRKQCAKCPWRKDVDPHDIPNGYCERRHAALEDTIAEGLRAGPLRLMACHETKPGRELPCVGWLANQLGPGNNIGLRLAVLRKQIDARFELVGEQHERFEDTLPRRRVSKRRARREEKRG